MPDHTQLSMPPAGPTRQSEGYGPQDLTQPNLPASNAYDPKAVSPYYQPPRPPANPARPPRRPAKKKKRGCMPGPGCIAGCFGVSGAMAVIGLLLLFLGYYQASRQLEEPINELEASLNRLDDPNAESGFESTFVYDRDGNQLWELFGQGRRQRVSLEDIPESVIQATIAAEDDDFYTNPGFDVQSNVRAIGQMIRTRQVVSGGSTITQQLVRNVVFDIEYRQERSVRRKLEEIALATVLTQRMSKDDILELYLNTIYYGNLAYGIEAAAQIYFGKSANELDVHEAALLAGLPQLPAIVDPLNPDPEIQAAVYSRQQYVINRMVGEGYLTEAEGQAAKAAPLNYVSPEVPLEAPHFTLYAINELEKLLISLGKPEETLRDGGLKVYTSIDLDFQAVAQRAAEQNVRRLRDAHNLTNSAVVVIHPPSGEILAMVGSVDYNNAEIDGEVNVATAMRQPGSTIKPFTYAAAMEQGFTAGSILWDVETRFTQQGGPDYVPRNYSRNFYGPTRVRDALANSLNIPAVLTLEYVGVDYLISFLQRMGTQSLSNDPGRYGLSLTLGGGEITLLEMTSNFATLARSGVYVEPTVILCVLDTNDNILYQYESRCPQGNLTNQTRDVTVAGTPVMDPRIAFIMSDILADNPARTPLMGANSPLNTGPLLTSVKTGTTDNFRDNWTVGYTHDVAIGVWSGNSDNTEMVNISGLEGAAPIWNQVITQIYQNFPMPPSELHAPAGLYRQEICEIRGLKDPATGCSARVEWFLDSPPLLPDGQGNLVSPAMPESAQPPAAQEFGPQLIEREAGIIEVVVRPLVDAQAAILASSNPGIYSTPKYCMVPVEVISAVPDARSQIFISPPPQPERQAAAYRYAATANIPILPQVPCTGDTIQSFGPADPGVVAQIVSPAAGQTVSGVIPIYGVVNYPDGYFFDYYKIEVRGGPFIDWTTMGNVHHNEMLETGVLETFYAEALPPGTYEIRLWLQGDLPPEQYLYSVPFNLVAP